VDVAAAARAWAKTWSRAWPTGDTEAVASLYADEALFYSHPFRERQAPREYVAWAFGEQQAAECRFGAPVVSGERAAVDWWAAITDKGGNIETVAGTSLLRFDRAGKVVEQRDAWAGEQGRRELPDWAR
jgi:ketosteroid isomerase-like protein